MWNFYLRNVERHEQAKRTKAFNSITVMIGGTIIAVAVIILIASILDRGMTLTISTALSMIVLAVVLPKTIISVLFLLRGERT